MMKKIITHEKPTYEFSVYKAPVSNVIPLKNTTLSKVYAVIISDSYKAVTSHVGALKDKQEQTACKINKLDYVTFSGEFKTRSVAGLIKHSSLFCVDLDDLEDTKAIKSKVIDLLPPSLMFVSPSGNGLKIVYKIDINDAEHLQYYNAFEVFFNEQLSLAIDDKCKDVPRACFLCHDSEAYFNEDAEVMDKSFIDTFFVPKQESTPESVSETITDVDTIIENLKTWIDKTDSFEVGNRNGYISKLAGAYNRYGVLIGIAENDLLSYTQDDFTADEIKAIVHSIYRNTSWHNTAEFKVDKKEEKEQKEPTPLLPIDGFPEYLQNFINEYTEVYRLPRDYVASGVLFTTALAIGNKIELKDKYDNIALLWMDIIGNVSCGKSHPIEQCLSYFLNKDSTASEEYKTRKIMFDVEQEKPKQERDKSLQAPTYFQYVIDDYTPESLASIHSINNRGLCIYKDELKGWLDDFGRYNKSGEQSTMLSSFYRMPMAINRASKEPIRINKPTIFLIGGIQPELLVDLAKDNRAENGFLSRMLHVFPDLDNKPFYNSENMDAKALANYHRYLSGLDSIIDEISLSLSSEAATEYENWYNKNAVISNNTNVGYLKGVYGKLDVQVLRLAVTIYGMNLICKGSESTEIDGKTMQTAINLIEYFRMTALKVYDIIFSNSNSKSPDKTAAIFYMNSIGKTQKEIAAALNMSQSQISKILKNIK